MTKELPPSRTDIEAGKSAALYGWTGKIIIAPAGECPNKLSGIEEEAVALWVNKIIIKGHDSGVHYSPSAFRYWAATLFERSTKEYRTICEHLAVIFESGERIQTEGFRPDSPPKKPTKPSKQLAQKLGKLTTTKSIQEIEM